MMINNISENQEDSFIISEATSTNTAEKTQTGDLSGRTVKLNTWNKTEHNVLLNLGDLEYSTEIDGSGRKSIYVGKRISRGTGFGTASTRHLMEKSFSEGCEGRMYNDASWSSHLFHLYMGMIPVDRKINAIQHYCGLGEQESIENFPQIIKNYKANIPISEDLLYDVESLKKLLYIIKTGSYNRAASKEIALEELIKSEKEILEFQKKDVFYLENDFIPHIIRILEKNIVNERPDTSSFGSVRMEMSEIGIQRWKETIDGEKQFVSFKRFEQLRPYMNSSQIDKLDDILNKREKALNKEAK